jgi:hypothetical protein
MSLKGPASALVLIVLGMILGGLSGVALPLGFGVAQFWLGIAVLVSGCIWFGGWGVIAAVVFPFLTSIAMHIALRDCLAVIPSNLIEGFLPALAFRVTGADQALHDKRSMKIYALWAVLVPSILGGSLSAGVWIAMGEADWQTFALLGFDWAVSNCLILLVIGFPLLYLLTPILRERGLLNSGWWH